MSDDTLSALVTAYLIGLPIAGLYVGYRSRSSWDQASFVAFVWPVSIWTWLGEHLRELRETPHA